MLDIGCWMLDVRCSAFGVRCSLVHDKKKTAAPFSAAAAFCDSRPDFVARLGGLEQGNGVGAFQRHLHQAHIQVRGVRFSEDDSRDLFGDGVQRLKLGSVLPNLLQRHTDQAHIDVGCVISEDDVGHIEDKRVELRVVRLYSWVHFVCCCRLEPAAPVHCVAAVEWEQPCVRWRARV